MVVLWEVLGDRAIYPTYQPALLFVLMIPNLPVLAISFSTSYSALGMLIAYLTAYAPQLIPHQPR
jgi:hypothetical protein